MRNFSFKRMTAWMLTLLMLLSVMPAGVFAGSTSGKQRFMQDVIGVGQAMAAGGDEEEADRGAAMAMAADITEAISEGESASAGTSRTAGTPTYVLAASDFQADSHTASAANVSSILDQIKEVYPTMDGFLFAGDYDVNYSDSVGGKAKLQETVQGVYGTGMDEVYVQGNHDGDDLVGSTLTKSGANDADDYGVFVINEKDYMWYNDDETTIKTTAANLESYLNAKLNDKYSKPIFVISHLPLHYSMRTLKGGNDGMHANYIFDVLNEAGKAGLNIIYLFGHDHSHGWDDYLGGAAIFLTKGDTINIAQNSTTNYKVEDLHFTYMNAGYVGYYGDTKSGADTTLTMTTFAITDTNVTISRYDSNGKHVLKAKGVYGGEYPDNKYASPVYAADTDVVDSSYTLKLNQFEPDPVVEDKTTGVSVSAPGVTGVTVTVEEAAEVPAGYTAYVTYDIELDGYNQGDTATVTIETPEGFDENKPAVVLYAGAQIAKDTDLSDGITFTTNHFSEYDVAQVDEEATNIARGNLAADATVDNNSSAPQAGNYYLIRPVRDGNGTLTNVSTKVNDSTGLDVQDTYLNAQDNNVWYYDGTHIILRSTGEYLSVGSTKDAAALTNNANATNLVNSVYENTNYRGTYTLAATQNATYKYLNRAGSGSFAGAWNSDGNGDEGSRWYFYKVTFSDADPVTLTVTPASKTVTNGKTANLTASVLVNDKAATSKTITWTSSDTTIATVDENGVVTGVKDGEATITATLTKANGQNVNGTVAVEIPVKVVTRTATSITVDPMTGIVERNAKSSATTGSTITVTYSDGSIETGILVTLSMLTKDGSAVSTSELGTIENLTVTYEGVSITGYTLNVVIKSGNNNPEYPNEGAVKVSKTGTGIDFQASGIAQVEVSASGVPVKKGVDVVVVIDTSSSMDKDVDGQDPSNGEKSRIDILSESLKKMLETFQDKNEDGSEPDIDIAVIDFNGYGERITGATLNGGYRDEANQAAVYTGTTDGNWKLISNVGLSANNFVGVETLDAANFAAMFNEDRTSGGTNYDSGLENAYNLLQLKKAANGEEERDQYVIFLSDGASNRYNGYENSANSAYDNWDKWLRGYWADQDALKKDITSNANQNAYPYFYNGNGTNHPHRMAEAIKGDPARNDYEVVIRSAANADPKYIEQRAGLGAQIYSIGFGLADDGGDYGTITETTMENVLKTISSGEGYYQFVKSADDLNDAFAKIASEIAYAAYNARYVDQMGANYDLQMKTSTYSVVENGTTENKTLEPKIEIISYDIYTRQDYLDGDITADKIGDRKGTSTVLETVTFNAAGTEAYSTLNSVGPNGETITAGTNILIGGVIYANNFWYNTNPAPVTIEGVSIPANKDTTTHLTTGSTNVLPSETFYWKMGTVQTSELAMRYYVYLTGSMEGTREAGSYPTNAYATLYYDNYLENPCYKDTVSPTMAWKEANVSYAFYLVNEAGKIIVNQTTGETGSFANKIAVTNPVVYETILLNNLDVISSIEVTSTEKGVLPDGYELYDTDSVYTIRINSNSTGSWTIAKGDNTVASTYVTQFGTKEDASAYSNDLLNGVDENGNTVVTGNDYTHTVVWFAVLWKIQALPDTVVIDYGVPVDISVLANDMFGENGKLAGIGAYSNNLNLDGYETDLADEFTGNYTGKYGSATADTATGKVRYTLNTMKMDGYEKFAYAVYYTGGENAGYYYDTITVIPATIIYYEESFVKFKDSNKTEYKTSFDKWNVETKGVWGFEIDNENQDPIQAEDRPGRFSLTDANNFYGYDGINSSATTYSLGKAMKVTVGDTITTQALAPSASFTFTGTGFDVISLTDNDSGVVFVSVSNENYEDGETAKTVNKFVDDYYGYAYGEYTNEAGKTVNGWYVNTEETNVNYKTTVYQVPVMKISGLEYGTYDVTIFTFYNKLFEHNGNNQYSFWLDSIRIYDPAGDGVTDENGTNDTTIKEAYIADNEYNPTYVTIRDQLVDSETLGSWTVKGENDEAKVVEGAVFIDGMGKECEFKDYANPGPNNETYLAGGQGVSFRIKTNFKPASVQIGAKLAFGASANLKNSYQYIEKEEGQDKGSVKTVEWKDISLATATDMYYELDIPDSVWDKETDTETNAEYWISPVIVLANPNDATAVISLTNIKVTDADGEDGVEEDDEKIYPVTVPEESGSGTSQSGNSGTYSLRSMTSSSAEAQAAETVEENTVTLIVDAETIASAKAILDKLFAKLVFELDVFEYTLNSLFGAGTTINVITSNDVEALTVNGNAMTNLSAAKGINYILGLIGSYAEKLGIDLVSDDYYVWSATVRAADTYEFVASDAEGVKSEPVTVSFDGQIITSINADDFKLHSGSSDAMSLMERLAERVFNPERVESVISTRADGRTEAVVTTSEDVEYVIVDGEIVDHYITETVIDLGTDETSVSRVFVTEVEDESAEVTAYNEEGVASSSEDAGE